MSWIPMKQVKSHLIFPLKLLSDITEAPDECTRCCTPQAAYEKSPYGDNLCEAYQQY